MSASIKKEVSQNEIKYNCNKQQTTILLPKINKVFWAQFYKIWREGPFWTHFFEMILSTSRKRCRQAKSSIFSGRWLKTQNGDQNRIYPSHFQTAKLFHFKRVLKNVRLEFSFFSKYISFPIFWSSVWCVVCGVC